MLPQAVTLSNFTLSFPVSTIEIANPLGIIKASQQIRGGHTFESKLFTFNILDRVGGGDAFASGLIYAMIRGYKPMDLINFAVASSVIKHTIHGDANITDDDKAIKEIMNQNFDIKR